MGCSSMAGTEVTHGPFLENWLISGGPPMVAKMDSSYVPLSKSDEKLTVEKILYGVPQHLH